MNAPLDPDMPVAELRLHMGELTADEVRVARAAIAWANTRAAAALEAKVARLQAEREAIKEIAAGHVLAEVEALDETAALEAQLAETQLELLSAMGEAGANLDRAVAAEARLADLTGEAMVVRLARAVFSYGPLGVAPDACERCARDLLTRAGILAIPYPGDEG